MLRNSIHVGYILPPIGIVGLEDRNPIGIGNYCGPLTDSRVTHAILERDEQEDPDAARRRMALQAPSNAGQSRGYSRLRFTAGSVEPLLYEGQLHALTVAPTGAGKGRGQIIPALLQSTAQAIVIDPKGENALVTATRRRRLGQQVYIIAPFGLEGASVALLGAINPFDLLKRPGADLENDAAMLAYMMCENAGTFRGGSVSNDAFWTNSATAFIKGVMLMMVSVLPEQEHNIGKLYELLHSDDVVYNLAVILDTHGVSAKSGKPKEREKDESSSPADATPTAKPRMNPTAYAEISAFLQTVEVTRSGILSTAQSILKLFSSSNVQACLSRTTFDIDAFVAGKPMTIYLVLPPDKLRSHAALLKLWITMLLKCVFSRRILPAQPTLFLLDEVAQLGHLDDIEKAITLGRGYGMQLWSFWQDLNQLRSLYPLSSIINNCGLISCFGARNHLMRKEYAELMGIPLGVVESLAPDEQLIMIDGKVQRAWLVDYLRDHCYAGLAAPNPFYGTKSHRRSEQK